MPARSRSPANVKGLGNERGTTNIFRLDANTIPAVPGHPPMND